jgi:hypothetical protein
MVVTSMSSDGGFMTVTRITWSSLTDVGSNVSMNSNVFSQLPMQNHAPFHGEGGSIMRSQAMYIRLAGTGLAVVLLLGLTACGGPPKWVTKGSGAFNEKDSKAFYGVGSVVGMRNEPLAWDAAENRGRAEIAKTFETYTGYLMRDYAASTTAGDFTKNTEEQHVERAIKTVTTATLSGVRPIDRYKDEKTNTYYVLTKLSLEDMKNNLEQAKELNAQVREFVRKNADKMFDRLEKEEEKRANQ